MLKNQSNKESNFVKLAILNVLEDGSIVLISTDDITREQKQALANIQVCCNNPSLVLRIVLYIEKKFNQICSFF